MQAPEKNHDVLIKPETYKSQTPFKLLPLSSFEQSFALTFVVDALWVFSDEINLDQLKASLSKVLDFYPECAGRYTTCGSMRLFPRAIELNNKGVPFRVRYEKKKSIQSAIEWDRHRYQNNIQVPSLLHVSHILKMKNGKSPTLSICITYFKDGTSIGVSASHGMFDGDSFYTFVTNWSTIFKGTTSLGDNKPISDRSLLPNAGHCDATKCYLEVQGDTAKPTEHSKGGGDQIVPASEQPLKPANKKAQSRSVALKYLGKKGRNIESYPRVVWKCLPGYLSYGYLFTERFLPLWMSPDALKNIKSTIESEAKSKFGTKFISLNEAISAHLSACCQTIFNLPPGKKMHSVTLINWRERIEGLPRNFSGNAISISRTSDFEVIKPTTSRDILINQRAEIATKIHDTLRKFADTPSPELKEYACDDLLGFQYRKFAADWDIPGLIRSMKPTCVWTNNFAKYPIYESDFGAKCVWVAPQYTVDMFIIWPAPPSVGGIYIIPQGLVAIALRKIANNKNAPFWKEFAMFEPNPDEFVKNIHGPHPLGVNTPW